MVPTNHSNLIAALLRLLMGTIVSIALAWGLGPYMAQAYLPVLQRLYTLLDGDHDVVSLGLRDYGVHGGRDHVFELVVAPHGYLYVDNTLVPTNRSGRGTVSLITGYLWQPLVVAIPFLLAWPAKRRREWLLRCVSLLLCSALVALIDIPTLLWSEVWSYYVQTIAPGSFSWLLQWGHFLKNGGQTLLGMLIAAESVVISQWAASRLGGLRNSATLAT